jgi:hypothetical protein
MASICSVTHRANSALFRNLFVLQIETTVIKKKKKNENEMLRCSIRGVRSGSNSLVWDVVRRVKANQCEVTLVQPVKGNDSPYYSIGEETHETLV